MRPCPSRGRSAATRAGELRPHFEFAQCGGEGSLRRQEALTLSIETSCSDHGSFTRAGYPSACLSEGRFADSNPQYVRSPLPPPPASPSPTPRTDCCFIPDALMDSMHTAQDTIDRPEYSIEHISEFVRIGLGYVVELAGGRVH